MQVRARVWGLNFRVSLEGLSQCCLLDLWGGGGGLDLAVFG